MRVIYNTLLFQKIQAWPVIKLTKTPVFWLSAFSVMGGASQDLSPHTILMGQQVDYKCHCRFQFREYAQTHEEHNNSMNQRTVGALALCPVGNGQGSFNFLSIATGRILNQLHATALPMPDNVINKIHRMAQQQKNNPGLVFADRSLNPDEYDDDDHDKTYYDNGDGEEEDEEVLSYDEVEGNDDDGNEMAAHRPPVANDDDDNNDERGDHDPLMADAPPPVDLVQPPGNPPGEIARVEAGDQAEETGVPMGSEIPGVEEEEATKNPRSW